MVVDVSKGAFQSGYSARDVAKLMGLSVGQVRGYVRAGFLTPRQGQRGEHRFSLQDIILLRTAKELEDRLPLRKIRRVLRKLREQLPSGRSLTGVRITAEGDSVLARDGASIWEPESGQAVLNFEVAELASKVAPLARRAAVQAAQATRSPSADEWYEVGCELEPCSPDQARTAYLRAIEIEPGHSAARVNLGRLFHEEGHIRDAEEQYRVALEADPSDVTAAYNLGVVLEDLGQSEPAVRAYEQAISSDARCADAHYNLSRLYEQLGDRVSAFRHLKAYKRLTDGG